MHLGANVRVNKVAVYVIAGLLILLYLYSIRTSSHEESVSLKKLLFAAIKAAEMGGLEVAAVHNQRLFTIESKGKTKEGINDPVTAADYRSHCVIYHSLVKAFPAVTVISEEKSKGCDSMGVPDLGDTTDMEGKYDDVDDDVISLAKDITIWIDPLDATKEFTENLLQYVTTMVCIAVKGKPVIGIIHKPFKDKTYWAWIGHGSSANLQYSLVQRNDRTPTLIVSRSHAGRVHNASKAAFGEGVKIVTAAGAGYKALEVAARNVTAYIHMTAIKKWDVCAGTAIINSLGGTTTSLSGELLTEFGPTDSTLLNLGLLATMNDHSWYLKKFNNTYLV